MKKDERWLAERQQDYVITTRRALHRIPEVRWQEDETVAKIRSYVELMIVDGQSICAAVARASSVECEFKIRELRGGLIVDVTVDPSLDRIILRADVDGLPVEEKTDLSFAATNGCMHACGHDTHAAMLLGTLRALIMKMTAGDELAHNLRLVFQRAEENPVTPSGGDVLVNEEGVCDGIAAAYGLHIWATGRPGLFQSRPGPFLGNSGRLGIRITGKGGHVAMPHTAVNPIRVAHAVMAALDGFQAATLGPLEPATLEPTIVQSGSASNVIPGEATVWYGVRTMLPRERHMEHLGKIEDRVRAVVAAFPGASVSFESVGGHPALINTPEAVSRIAKTLITGGEEYAEHQAILGGEDFAHYLRKVPGAFFMLGAGGPDAADHHNARFNPDESVLWRGVHYWLLLATASLCP